MDDRVAASPAAAAGKGLDELLMQKRPHLSWLLKRKRKIDESTNNNSSTSYASADALSTPWVENGTKNGHTQDTIPDYLPLGQPTHGEMLDNTQHDRDSEHATHKRRRRLESEEGSHRDSLQRLLAVAEEDEQQQQPQASHTFQDDLFARPAPTLPSFLKHLRRPTPPELSVSPPAWTNLSPSSSSPPRPTVAVLSPASSPIRSRQASPPTSPDECASVTFSSSSTPTKPPVEVISVPSSPTRSRSPSPSPSPSPARSPERPIGRWTMAPGPHLLTPPQTLNPAQSPPWAQKGRLYTASADTQEDRPRPEDFYRSLGQEVKDFADWASPTLYEWKARYDALNRISQTIRSLWPHSNIHLFGSSKTKLCLSGSDIDLVITGATSNGWKPLPPLRMLATEIRRRQSYTQDGYNRKSVKVIESAKVPIIKMIDWESNIALDICLDNTSGPVSSEILITALKDMPHLKPLALTLKYFLRQQKKNEPFEGNMGSYLLVLLIIHVIQKRKKRIEEERRLRATALNLVQARTNLIKAKLLAEQGADTTRAEEQIQSSSNRTQISAEPNEDDDEALGHLFVDFFREIGVNLDFAQAISVRDSGSVFEKASRHPFNQNMFLAVEDPENKDKDVGKGCWNILTVRQVLREAYQRLVTNGHSSGTGHVHSTAPCRTPGEKSILSRIMWPDFKLEEMRKRYELKYKQPIDAAGRVNMGTGVAMAMTDGVGTTTTAMKGGRGGARPTRGAPAGGRGGPMTWTPSPRVGIVANYAANANARGGWRGGRGGYRGAPGYYAPYQPAYQGPTAYYPTTFGPAGFYTGGYY